MKKSKIKFNMKKSLIQYLNLFLIFILIISFVNAENQNSSNTPKINFTLISNKQVYQVGEDVNLTLKINNSYNEIIDGEIKGKVIIGDVGYEIQCFEINSPSNETQYLRLSSLPASLSNSNRKTMSTLYACGGTQMQSTKTMIDNKPISQTGQESYLIGPFIYSYSYNGSDFEVKSNILNITVTANQNQQQTQQQNQNTQSQNNQNQQESNQNTQQNQQSQQTGQNSPPSQNQQNQNPNSQSSLSQQNQQALSQNQQNSQSVNQLKKDIAKAKLNPFNNTKEENERNFWYWLLLLILIITISIIVFNKYFKKEIRETNEIEEKETKPKIPRYLEILNSINLNDNIKENSKKLSQAIRNYIAFKNGLETEDLTYSKAMKFTTNKELKTLLEICEKNEFSGKIERIDVKKEIEKLKKIMKE